MAVGICIFQGDQFLAPVLATLQYPTRSDATRKHTLHHPDSILHQVPSELPASHCLPLSPAGSAAGADAAATVVVQVAIVAGLRRSGTVMVLAVATVRMAVALTAHPPHHPVTQVRDVPRALC